LVPLVSALHEIASEENKKGAAGKRSTVLEGIPEFNWSS
jgi:hypothetical protein